MSCIPFPAIPLFHLTCIPSHMPSVVQVKSAIAGLDDLTTGRDQTRPDGTNGSGGSLRTDGRVAEQMPRSGRDMMRQPLLLGKDRRLLYTDLSVGRERIKAASSVVRLRLPPPMVAWQVS